MNPCAVSCLKNTLPLCTFKPSVHLKISAHFQKTGFRSVVGITFASHAKGPQFENWAGTISLFFHNCSISSLLRRNSNTTKALRPRETKTVAKAVIDAKYLSLEDSSRTLDFFLFAAKNGRYLQIKECNPICSLIRVPRSVRWKRQTQPWLQVSVV